MVARVSQAWFPVEHATAGLQVIRQALLPALRRVAGYQGCVLLSSRRSGVGLAVVLWESAEAADAAAIDENVIAAHVQLTALGLAIEARELFAVAVRDRFDADR